MAFSTIAASSTVRASGPHASNENVLGSTPRRLTRPYVGFTPTIPHSAAGIRIEPPVSEPVAAIAAPAATAPPEPPLDPPQTRERSQGFLVGSVYTPHASSCVVVFPTMTAPAARRFAT